MFRCDVKVLKSFFLDLEHNCANEDMYTVESC